MKIRILIVLIACMFALSANSATLVISGGQLMGATDVDVGGTLYDVSFLDGSCNSLYSGCSEFTFKTIAAAALASQALLDQVFIGVYDDEPALTNGVANLVVQIITPARIKDPTLPLVQWIGQQVINYSVIFPFEEDEVIDAIAGPTFDTTQNAGATFAVWAPTAVPLPTAAWLFMSAIAVLAGGKRISRSKRSV